MKLIIVFLGLWFVSATTWSGFTTKSRWTGVWRDESSQAVLLMKEQAGFIEVQGQDSAATFSMACLLNNDKIQARCLGNGINHVQGFRFLYENDLRMTKDGTIIESWTATGRNKVMNGKAVFSRFQAANNFKGR